MHSRHGMSSIGTLALAMPWLAMLAGCQYSCSFNLGAGDPVKKMQKTLRAQLGVDVEVTCPKIDPFGVSMCTGTLPDGQRFDIEVKKGKDGDFALQSRGLIVGANVEQAIRTMFADNAQLEFDTVTCPPVTVLAEGENLACMARVQGVDVPLEVVIVDGTIDTVHTKGGVIWSDQAVKLAVDTFAEQGITMQGDCGPPVRAAVPDSTFTCTATAGDGESLTLYYKIIAADRITMQTEPFE